MEPELIAPGDIVSHDKWFDEDCFHVIDIEGGVGVVEALHPDTRQPIGRRILLGISGMTREDTSANR